MNDETLALSEKMDRRALTLPQMNDPENMASASHNRMNELMDSSAAVSAQFNVCKDQLTRRTRKHNRS